VIALDAPLSCKYEHLPALFRAADSASLRAQRDYLSLVKADLMTIILASAVTSVAACSPSLRAGLAITGAVLMLGGVVLTTFLLQQQPDRLWFNARAVADSVKTIAWRYMTCADPFARNLNLREADGQLCKTLDRVLMENRAVGGALGGIDGADEQVTARMREIRQLGTTERLRVYLISRVRDQREWYAAKALDNRRTSGRWLWAVGGTQMGGAIAAIAMVRWPNLEFNLPSVLASLAAAFVAWLQVKRHQELASSYGLAAHELGLSESQSMHVHTDDELSDFVDQAEGAISREHTMWVARRSE